MQQGYDEQDTDGELDLDKWSRQWLQTKGVSKIECEYEQEGGKFTKFNLKQSSHKNADKTLRE